MGSLSWIGFAQRAVLLLARSVGLGDAVRRSLLNYESTLVHVALDVALPGSQPIRILHLSDLHLDGIPDGCERLCAALLRVPCDICAITGDFVDPAVGDLAAVETRLARVLSSARAPYGVFAVLGDHDPETVKPVLARVGVQLLAGGEARVLCRGVWLRFTSAMNNQSAVRLDRPCIDGPLLFLAHSPDSIMDALQSGAHYYLCGHTHGGQVCLPGGYPIVTRIQQPRRLARGAWVYCSLRGYTSRGLGVCGLSPRLFCRPEIAIHVLT